MAKLTLAFFDNYSDATQLDYHRRVNYSAKTCTEVSCLIKKEGVGAYQPVPITVKSKLKLDMPEIVCETISVRLVIST